MPEKAARKSSQNYSTNSEFLQVYVNQRYATVNFLTMVVENKFFSHFLSIMFEQYLNDRSMLNMSRFREKVYNKVLKLTRIASVLNVRSEYCVSRKEELSICYRL